MLKRIPRFALILLIAVPIPMFARANSAPASKPFVIRNVRVFDGERTIPKTDVVVADGKIAAVAPGESPPAGAEVIDGSGETLLPGLIDSYVHMWTRDILQRSLALGLTTALDMFMRVGDMRYLREEEAAGTFDIADFRTAGTSVTSPAGHGVEEGFPIPMIPNPQEAQAFVDARNRAAALSHLVLQRRRQRGAGETRLLHGGKWHMYRVAAQSSLKPYGFEERPDSLTAK